MLELLLLLRKHENQAQTIDFFSFLATPQYMEFLGQGSDLNCNCDLSCSCSNSGSLTHCARLGIEPVSQCCQDGPIVTQWELQLIFDWILYNNTAFLNYWLPELCFLMKLLPHSFLPAPQVYCFEEKDSFRIYQCALWICFEFSFFASLKPQESVLWVSCLDCWLIP